MDVYMPLAQRPSRFAFVYMRVPPAGTSDGELRAAVARVHPEVAMGTPRLLAAGIEEERARPRFLAALLVTFAVFAAAVALIGVHGVVAYAVRQRQREIAIRMAVGANSRAVMTLFLRYGSGVLLIGVTAGVAGAMALGRLLESQLHGVRAVEPRTLVLTVLAMTAMAGSAMWWPARRAASLDPLQVLNQQ